MQVPRHDWYFDAHILLEVLPQLFSFPIHQESMLKVLLVSPSLYVFYIYNANHSGFGYSISGEVFVQLLDFELEHILLLQKNINKNIKTKNKQKSTRVFH